MNNSLITAKKMLGRLLGCYKYRRKIFSINKQLNGRFYTSSVSATSTCYLPRPAPPCRSIYLTNVWNYAGRPCRTVHQVITYSCRLPSVTPSDKLNLHVFSSGVRQKSGKCLYCKRTRLRRGGHFSCRLVKVQICSLKVSDPIQNSVGFFVGINCQSNLNYSNINKLLIS